MADLSDLNAAQTIKIAGAGSSGSETTYVDATSAGGIHANLRNNAGTEIGTSAAPVRIDPTGTTTQPVSDAGGSLTIDAVSLPLPTGASTEATLATRASETTLSAINAKLNSLGQKTSANSAPVVLASDQSAIPASQSGTWNINNVSGTVSLPTGASTAANQTTANSSLSSIDGKLTTTNSTLAAIDAGIPVALGQTTMANSMPVVISSDQSTIPVTDVINSSGIQGAISVTTSATAARVGVSNLTGRKNITALNNGTATIYWGYTNAVTASTGTPLVKSQMASWDVGANITIYFIAASGSHDVRVTEAA